MSPLLSVQDLSVQFRQDGREMLAVDRVSFDIAAGKTVALVGESGSGKSVTALSILKLLPYPMASHPSGTIMFCDKNLLALDEGGLRKVRGNDIAMIFQEPMTSLNPLHRVERQIGEILQIHQGMAARAARQCTVELLAQVGIHEPEKRLDSFPHQLSGGQRQRVMIAMALANNPSLLIADEPTTALDVTIQKQILDLLTGLQNRYGMGLIMITHDMGVVAETADRVIVQYKGRKMEEADVLSLFERPQSPYTRALLAALPENVTGNRLPTVSDFMNEGAGA